MPPDPFAIIAVIVVVMFLVSPLILLMVSRIGPWNRFAKRFPHKDIEASSRHQFVSMVLPLGGYNGCLSAQANGDYLTLSTPGLLFHQPFTVSRADIQYVASGRSVFRRYVKVRIENVQLTFYGSVLDSLFFVSLVGDTSTD